MAELRNEKPILGKLIVFPNMLESAIENGLKEKYFINRENRSLYKQMLDIYEKHGGLDKWNSISRNLLNL